jgi:putative addiction module component (TIGR02574 family)
MNMANTLSEITAMSVPDRIRLVQLILDSIAAEQELPDSIPQSHKDELDRRLAAYEANPTAGSTWEEVKARLLGQS